MLHFFITAADGGGALRSYSTALREGVLSRRAPSFQITHGVQLKCTVMPDWLRGVSSPDLPPDRCQACGVYHVHDAC